MSLLSEHHRLKLCSTIHVPSTKIFILTNFDISENMQHLLELYVNYVDEKYLDGIFHYIFSYSVYIIYSQKKKHTLFRKLINFYMVCYASFTVLLVPSICMRADNYYK